MASYSKTFALELLGRELEKVNSELSSVQSSIDYMETNKDKINPSFFIYRKDLKAQKKILDEKIKKLKLPETIQSDIESLNRELEKYSDKNKQEINNKIKKFQDNLDEVHNLKSLITSLEDKLSSITEENKLNLRKQIIIKNNELLALTNSKSSDETRKSQLAGDIARLEKNLSEMSDESKAKIENLIKENKKKIQTILGIDSYDSAKISDACDKIKVSINDSQNELSQLTDAKKGQIKSKIYLKKSDLDEVKNIGFAISEDDKINAKISSNDEKLEALSNKIDQIKSAKSKYFKKIREKRLSRLEKKYARLKKSQSKLINKVVYEIVQSSISKISVFDKENIRNLLKDENTKRKAKAEDAREKVVLSAVSKKPEAIADFVKSEGLYLVSYSKEKLLDSYINFIRSKSGIIYRIGKSSFLSKYHVGEMKKKEATR